MSTSTIIASNSGCAGLEAPSNSWANMIAGIPGGGGIFNANSAIDVVTFRRHEFGEDYSFLYRGFLTFDLSSISDTATILSASLFLYGKDAVTQSLSLELGIFGTSSYSSIDSSDYTKVNDTLKSDTTKTVPEFAIEAYNEFPLNVSGILDIASGLVSNICYFSLRENHYDVGNIEPGLLDFPVTHIESYPTSTVGKEPYLLVSYSVSTTTTSTTTPAPLQADFTGTPRFGVAPLIVHFEDLSTGCPTSLHWDFDNGNTSDVQSPPDQEYDNVGSYDVSLTVSN